MGKRIHFVSLGCAKNRVDTEVMLGVSAGASYQIVAEPADAEVIVVNTCGFIGPAKEESIETILAMAEHKTAGTCERLVVAGCLSQRYADELAVEMPEVDHFLGSSDMLKLEEVLAGSAERMLVGNPAAYTMRATDPRVLSVRPHSAFIKIAEGCNRTCSFCAIPGIRGKQRSRGIDDVVREVEQLVAMGLVEANLVSQDTVAYGRDLAEKPGLAELIRRVADVKGLRWLRVHYLYPETLTASLLDVIADHPTVLPYIDMPLQHVSDGMLGRMRRGHGEKRLYTLVERLRKRLPDMVFRSTFLVGHPGETDADFESLLRFVEWAEFDRVGVFAFSPEEGTKSFDMDGPVPAGVARKRQRRLMAVQRKISKRKLKAMVGSELDVLVEGESDESDLLLEGRFWGQAPEVDGKVILANGTARSGELRRALVTAASDHDLVADLLDADGEHRAPPDARPVRRRLPLQR